MALKELLGAIYYFWLKLLKWFDRNRQWVWPKRRASFEMCNLDVLDPVEAASMRFASLATTLNKSRISLMQTRKSYSVALLRTFCMDSLYWTLHRPIVRIRSLKLSLLQSFKTMFSDVFRRSVPSSCLTSNYYTIRCTIITQRDTQLLHNKVHKYYTIRYTTIT